MGLHFGEPLMAKDPTTRRMNYFGPPVNITAHITAMTHGGQVIISQTMRDKLAEAGESKRFSFVDLGKFQLKGAAHNPYRGSSDLRQRVTPNQYPHQL